MLPVSHSSFSHMLFNKTREASAIGVKDRFLFFEFDGVISLTSGFEPCDSRHVEEGGSNHTTWNLEGVGGGSQKWIEAKSIGALHLIGFLEI